MKKAIKILVGILCLCVMLLTGVLIATTQHGYWKSKKTYDAVSQHVSYGDSTEPTEAAQPVKEEKPAETKTDASEPVDETMPSEATEETEPLPTEPSGPVFPEVDFEALREENKDIVGWIYSPDNRINYPIVQTKDNKYYLERMFDGTKNNAGCPYLDAKNKADFSDHNNIVYGHNMQDGSMFADVLLYRDPGYYDEHPQMLLVTPEQNYTIDIFSGYVLSGWGNAWKLEFKDDAEWEAWLKDSWKKSNFPSTLEPDPKDNIITLSTCCYDFDDARYVLLGILKPVEKTK